MQTQKAIILALLLAYGLHAPLAAQATGQKADVIYLNHGKPLVGKILGYVQGKSVTIQLPDGEQRVVAELDVRKIVQGALVEDGQPAKRHPAVAAPVGKGWYHQAQLTLTPGQDDFNQAILGVGFALGGGYRTRRLGAGLGLGADNYGRQGETVFPLYAELRGYLPTEAGNEFFLSATAGHGFAFKSDNAGIIQAEGGFMWHPAIGFQGRTRDAGLDYQLDIGVRFQQAAFTQEWFNGDLETRDILFRRIALRFGVFLR